MPIERTLFFTKSYIPRQKAEIISEYLELTLLNQQQEYFPEHAPIQYSIDELFTYSNLSLQRWLKFYETMKSKNPKVHEYMCSDFAAQQHTITGLIISGDKIGNKRGIIEVVRDCLGSRILEENPDWTIRGKFGRINQQGKPWRTVAHASTRKEATRELELFKKWRIIH